MAETSKPPEKKAQPEKKIHPIYQLIEEDISINYNPNKKKKEQISNSVITGKTE